MQWLSQAPANIALIKYMGKKNKTNLGNNPSLSYTLANLRSTVSLEQHAGEKDRWEPLETPGTPAFSLSSFSQERFLQHFARLKAYFHYEGNFIVRSSNNFPQGNGLASSASSFAALTKVAALALSELSHQPLPTIEQQAELSRQGSGSSCRSFFAPWALWQDDNVGTVDLPYKELLHQVIIISHAEKKVSSSEAHRRVLTSPFYSSRKARALENLKNLTTALELNDWHSAYLICWREFYDMHQLFSSSQEPFSYISEESNEVLGQLQELWQREKDGPLITMDAGPNIHLLYRPEQAELALQFKHDYLIGNYDVL